MRLALLVAALFFAGNTVLLAQAPAPSRMQVVAREFSYSLSRTRLKPGSAVIELANFVQVEPGQRAELTVRLAPGRYSFWCSVADHRARGMRATLIVR